MSARRAARPVPRMSHDFDSECPRSVSARETYLGESVVRVRVHGPHRRVLTRRPVAWTRKPPGGRTARRVSPPGRRASNGRSMGEAPLLEHSASEAFAAEARQARQADRKLATDLGRPGPSGPDARGDYLDGLAPRPRLSQELESTLIEAAKRGDQPARQSSSRNTCRMRPFRIGQAGHRFSCSRTWPRSSRMRTITVRGHRCRTSAEPMPHRPPTFERGGHLLELLFGVFPRRSLPPTFARGHISPRCGREREGTRGAPRSRRHVKAPRAARRSAARRHRRTPRLWL